MNLNTPKKSVTRNFKPVQLILGVGVLAAAIGLGSTLAASINLNTGAPIEFGQGVAQTTSCDGEVTLTPISTFVNAEGAGGFKFSAITLSGLDTTDQSDSSEGCAGKSFTIKTYNESGVLLDEVYSISVGSGAFDGSAGVISNENFGEDGSVTLTFDPTTAIAATDVYRITIESGVATGVSPIGISIGDDGPGGGKVFYISEAGFDCGPTYTSTGSPDSGQCHYLEAAQDGWKIGAEPSMVWAVVDNELTDVSALASESSINNASAGIGLGYLNSLSIVAQGNDATTAAGAARTYAGGGKNDWYLPTAAELNQMCKWARGLAWTSDATVCTGGELNSGRGASGFDNYYYWSSSEFDLGKSWAQDFDIGDQQQDWGKGYEFHVRPVRAF